MARRKLAFGAAAVLVPVLALGAIAFAQGAANVRAVSDREGQSLAGGGCGYTWVAGTDPCATGTTLCGNNPVTCSDLTINTLDPNGDGNEVPVDCSFVACMTCLSGTLTCGAADVHQIIQTVSCSGG
jgi:hypothetical protein